ncbi:peptidylprolyl isomerase [Nocardia sp. NPDC058497]|uniref:peptidylprolyl isomerase n=1 Tax=Nocardia sp. NPDC058497 TaxID=3346529 RepID=UPI003653F848
MPSNEQRRAAAKRKLERQLERRAEQEKKRKRLVIAGSVLGVIVVAAAVTGVYFLTKGGDEPESSATASSTSTKPPQTPGVLPAVPARPASVTCAYPVGAEPASKPVAPPSVTSVTSGPDTPTTKVTIDSTQGPIGLELDSAQSPCTVNSFVSLAQQGYFDGTSCHRVSAQPGFEMLQCGDPTATGTGGPGYAFANEYPTDQYEATDPALNSPLTYQRGVVAMANSGLTPEGTNGSQFFLVFGDTKLPPKYTIFGTIDEAGLQTLQKVGAAGDDGSMSAGGGKPNMPISFNTVNVG